jgi:hypothetical protein
MLSSWFHSRALLELELELELDLVADTGDRLETATSIPPSALANCLLWGLLPSAVSSTSILVKLATAIGCYRNGIRGCW